MPGLSDQEIKDLGQTTLENLRQGTMTQLATTFTQHEIINHFADEASRRMGGGDGIKKRVMVKHSGHAGQTRLYSTYTYNVEDNLKELTARYARTRTYYMWERRELLENRGKEKILDFFKTKKADGFIALAEHMEDQGWGAPTDSSDDLNAQGIPHWLLKETTATTGAFLSANPSGFTSGRGGIDSTAFTGWRNWAATYATVSPSDLIEKMKKGHRHTKWKMAKNVEDMSGALARGRRYYTNESVVSGIERLAEGRNENLGVGKGKQELAPLTVMRDASTGDELTFRRHPFIYVPKLNDDARSPVYGVDLSSFYMYTLDGDTFHEHTPRQLDKNPNIFVVDVDLSWNMICENLREQQVYALAA